MNTTAKLPTRVVPSVICRLLTSGEVARFRRTFIESWLPFREALRPAIHGPTNQRFQAPIGERHVLFPDPPFGRRSGQEQTNGTSQFLGEGPYKFLGPFA